MDVYRKVILEILNLLFFNRFFFYCVKRFRLVDALFVMYPADQSFADHYTFRWRQRLIRWKPFFVGIITHPSGKITLKCAISTKIDGENYDIDGLRGFHKSVEKLASFLGANVSTHLAGTLPGRLTGLRVSRGRNSMNERRATVANVIKAIETVREKHGHNKGNPVIILGSMGYIGREVSNQLQEKGVVVVGVDIQAVIDQEGSTSTVYTDPKIPHLVVNITRPEAINKYIDRMSSNTVVINEVYPAPHQDVLAEMKAKGIDVYHIGGVQAKSQPTFPGPYAGAVPCCAALSDEDYPIVLVQL